MHVIDVAGASDVAGHDTDGKPGSGSVTVTPVSDTVPVLVTANEYATWPLAFGPLAVFSRSMLRVCVGGIVAES